MSTPVASSSTHKWRFFRAGGFDQVRIERGVDLVHLPELDQKLWVALACPTRGIEFDPKTLDLLDTDKDGRIRAPEVLAAVKWACSAVGDPGLLLRGQADLPLSAFNDKSPVGQQLLASARRILINLGKGDATDITLEDATDTARIFAMTRFNGDGIVAADAAGDVSVQALMADIMNCVGSEADRSGKPGVSQAKVQEFFAAAQAYADWSGRAEAEAASLLPLGPATAAAVAACQAVRAKIDDYFARCRLAAFDARAVPVLNRPESEYAQLAAGAMTRAAAELTGFPLARIEPGRALPLEDGLNPAWHEAMARFRAAAVTPLLGERMALTPEDWSAINARLAPYEAWQAAKAGAAVEKLGLARIRDILAGAGRDTLLALIAEDRKYEPEANGIVAVEKILRFSRDLGCLLNNFVSFRDFYARKDKAVFQAGTLYLDGRACDLCVRVDDAGKHAALGGLAKTYLAYCDCTRPATGEKMTIAVGFTGGDSDHLMVGRNGLFYDRKGRDWDATITRIVENPISIRQAFLSPYKKLVRLIEEQVAKRAAAAEAASDKKLGDVAATTAQLDKMERPPPAAAAAPRKTDVGTVAAIGVALGSIGTFVAAILSKFVELGWWIPVAILGVILLISGPSMLIAWLKLRQRNLGPILDANGWAVNARAKINVPFGGALTRVATLPEGAERSVVDPYAEKHPLRWVLVLLVLLVLGGVWTYRNGRLHAWTGGRFGKAAEAPAEAVDAPPPAAPAADAPVAAPG